MEPIVFSRTCKRLPGERESIQRISVKSTPRASKAVFTDVRLSLILLLEAYTLLLLEAYTLQPDYHTSLTLLPG